MTLKTILMIPSWYPTKDNPFQGSFFREQALILSQNYNFIVLRINEKHIYFPIYYIKSLFRLTKPKVTFIQDDKGLQEYCLDIQKPMYFVWAEFKYKLQKKLKNNIPQGVGKLELQSITKSIRKSIKQIKKLKLLPDFNCVYSVTTQDMVILGKAFATEYSVPHVTAEHAPFPWPGTTIKDATKEAIESADAFLAISSDKVRQIMLQNIRIKPNYVWNFCDETKFSISKSKNLQKTFLIVAANSFYKNYPLFICTMEELKKIAKKDFRIIIAGYNANKGYSQNAKELEKMIQASSFVNNTEMLEAVARDDMPALYNRCDAFVMTSIQEGLPISAIEASMSGLPVFSTRCGGVEDYIDETMGKIVSITDYKALALACNDFLNGTTKYDSLKIREKTISFFGREAFIKNVSTVFDSVIQN